MKGSNKFCFLSALFVALTGVLTAYAQVDYSTATLKGTVTDPQGAVIAGASVTVKNQSTGLTKAVKANTEGSYLVPVLPPGTYQITVEAAGFRREVINTFTLAVGTVSVYDVHLQVGAASETIEVGGDSAPVIQVTQTQQADYINQIAEENIPSIGRDYSATIQLLPGMTNAEAIHSSGAQRNIGAFAVNNFTTAGGNGRGGLVTIDGGENDYGSGSSRTAHISPDAIQELQVNRNSFTAEFGFTLAEHVNVVTKSGGNQLHGNLFGLFRDQRTDAKPFFQISNNDTMNQDYHIGGDLGGALIKDKLFFFLNTEAYRTTFESLKTFNTSFFTGPSAAQQVYIQKVAMSNPGAAAGLTAFLTPANNPFVQKLVAGQSGFFPGDQKWVDSMARLDWLPTSSDTFTFRFLQERLDSPLDLGGPAGGYGAGVGPTIAPSYATSDTIRDYEALVTWSHIFSPSLLNTLRVQIVPDNVADFTWNNNHGGPTTPFSAFTDGFGTFGPLLGAEVLGHQRRYQFEDSVTWSHGKHTFKFGESFRPVKYTYFDNLYAHSQVAYVPGILPILTPGILPPSLAAQAVAAAGLPPANTNLTSLQSFGFGLPTQFRTSTGNNALIANWAYYGGVYFQDSWKMTSRLTVDAGIRFDADQESFPGQSTNYYASPRVGFAFDVFGDHKTLLRAGGGIFVAPAQFQNAYYSNLYNPVGTIGFAQAVETIGTPGYAALLGALFAAGNLPVLKPVTIADYTAAGITIAQGRPNGIGIVNPGSPFAGGTGYKNNYGIQASFSIQHELTKNMSIEIGYNMQHTVHLQDPLEVGFVNSGAFDPLLGPILKPNPANNPLIGGQPKFETLTNYCACGGAIYHAGTISLTRRFADHLQFQSNYTWSKAIDDVLDFSSFTSTFFPTSQGKDRAVSPYNISHIFTTSAVYTTPFHYDSGGFFLRALADITLSPVLSIRSGTPFELFDSPAVGAAGNGLVQEALNQARPFNAPRDSGILPWNYRWDMRFNKDFRLSKDHEALRLGFSVTAANLLNHTNFTGANGIFPAGTAALAAATAFPNGGNLLNGPYNIRGVKTLDFQPGFVPGSVPLSFNSADVARQIQFGLRLSF
ncbi:MAG TPA: TonB-dependent receptor [Candidatus Angelobacter sp.]|nr:TonB-dependent receptor [Candidatus Angelobacter sp.]